MGPMRNLVLKSAPILTAGTCMAVRLAAAVRCAPIVILILISLHVIFRFSNVSPETLEYLEHLAKWRQGLPPNASIEHEPQCAVPPSSLAVPRRANATFVILARNSEVMGVVESIKQNEDRFNRKFGYPYVFLNDEPFSEEFIRLTTQTVSSETKYGLIPKEQWNQPSWINETKATEGRDWLVQEEVIYGDSVPYRNMCRFNSGFFYRQPLLLDYKYYWRIEPGVQFFCDLDYDPFLFMQENKKAYGFTISLYEFDKTIPTLWKASKEFVRKNPQYLAKDNLLQFLSDTGGADYNMCHFWSNFEIGDMDFWRSEAYSKFFEHLESKGGFYYERWGDAPVHSIAAGLFLRKDQVHFFSDIGYRHAPFQHCPQGELHGRGKCWCDVNDSFDYADYSCHRRYEMAMETQHYQGLFIHPEMNW